MGVGVAVPPRIRQAGRGSSPNGGKGSHGCHERYRLLADIAGDLSPAEWQGTGEIGLPKERMVLNERKWNSFCIINALR